MVDCIVPCAYVLTVQLDERITIYLSMLNSYISRAPRAGQVVVYSLFLCLMLPAPLHQERSTNPTLRLLFLDLVVTLSYGVRTNMKSTVRSTVLDYS